MLRNGRFQRDENVLFIMTGGTPKLSTYRAAFEAR